MLVRCQECKAEISDAAVRCPRCGAGPDAYLGTKISCSECGVGYRAAYRSCGECGAPAPVAPSGQATGEPVSAVETQLVPAEAPWLDAETSALAGEREPRSNNAGDAAKKGIATRIATAVVALGAVAVAVVAFVAPKLVGFTAGYVAARSASAPTAQTQQSSEAEIHSAWVSMEADPSMGPFYREFRTGFPEDYADFVGALVKRAQISTDKESDIQFGFEYMQFFVDRNATSVAAASDEILAAYADQLAVLGRTLQQESVSQCAAFFRGEMPSDFRPSERVKAQMVAGDLLVLRAIKSGRQLGMRRSEPTEEQVQAFGDALAATGIDTRLIDAFYDDTLSNLSLADQCATGVAFATVQAGLATAESAFWTSLDFAQVANEAAAEP
jgi:hypothetical protein